MVLLRMSPAYRWLESPYPTAMEVVVTDLSGQYSMRSPLDFGYVFVSTPDGYEPAERLGNRPKFWQHVVQGERLRLSISVCADSRPIRRLQVIAVADLQIANRAGDRERLRNLYVLRPQPCRRLTPFMRSKPYSSDSRRPDMWSITGTIIITDFLISTGSLQSAPGISYYGKS